MCKAFTTKHGYKYSDELKFKAMELVPVNLIQREVSKHSLAFFEDSMLYFVDISVPETF